MATISEGATLRLSARHVGLVGIALARWSGSNGTINIGEGDTPGILDVAGVGGGEGDATLNFNHNAPAHRFENSEGNPVLITGSSRVDHIGVGTTILDGEKTYTGETTISDGTLLMNGSAANSAFFVRAGGTLGGSGTVGSTFLAGGGSLSPGNSVGTLTVAGDFTWEAGGVFLFDLGLDSFSSDFLAIGGDFLKQGDGEWAFEFADYGWALGHTYDLATFTATDFAAGDFSFLNDGPFAGHFAIEANVLQFTLTQVPEPTTYALLLGTGALLFTWKRRRRRAAPPPEGPDRQGAPRGMDGMERSVREVPFAASVGGSGTQLLAKRGATGNSKPLRRRDRAFSPGLQRPTSL